MSYFIIESVIKVKLRIKDLREDHDLTQKQIANVLMCDQSLYSKYERGEREIPLSLLIVLADFYKTSLDYLTCRTNNPKILKWTAKAVSKNDTAEFYAILNYSIPSSFLDASTRLSLMLSASLKSLPTAVM